MAVASQRKFSGKTARHLTTCFTSIALLAVAACKEPAPHAQLEGPSASSVVTSPFELVEQIVLEENEDVINVVPAVRIDPDGGYLIADFQAAQFRKYRADGSIEYTFGSRGRGPREFTSPIAALRLPSANILAVDGLGKSVVFTPQADSVLTTFRNPVTAVYDVDLLSEGTALYSGQGAAERHGSRLHVVELPSGRLLRSFFAPEITEEQRVAAASAGLTNSDVRSDTIATVFALSDTVYLFTAAGELLEKIQIPFQHFRFLSSPPPNGGGIEAAKAWFATFSMVSEVFWRHDGGFLIQYQDRENLIPQWRVLGMNRHGEWEFELSEWPQILAVHDSTPIVVSVAQGSDAPNTWSIARLK